MRESRGEWIAFLDSDDEWVPGKLEAEFAAASKLGARAVCSNASRVTPDGLELGPLLDWGRARLRFADLIAVNRVVCSSCVVHRAVLAKTGGFPEGPEFKAVEDYALWLRVAALTDIAYCHDTLVQYRDDPQSSVRSEQGISPEMQKSLVLAATGDWLLGAEIGASRRIPALASVSLARFRATITSMARGKRRGAR